MNSPPARRHATIIVAVLVVLVAAVFASVPIGSGASSAQKQSYSAILMNPFIGNDWRPQMQKYAEVVVKKAPLKAKISSFKVVTTQNNDPNLQSPALQSAILEEPDIIAMIVASETALNGLIQTACSKGIVVVTFDTQASAPCAWKLAPDWVAVGRTWALWMVKQVGGSGKILVDRGTAGVGSSTNMNKGMDAVLKKYPKIKVIEYFSKYSPGEETSKVTQLLAAHKDVEGIITQAYLAQEAMKKAKVKLPATGFTYPTAMKACLARNNPCFLVGVPPWISAEALRLGVNIKDGKVAGKPRFIPFLVPLFQHNNKVKITTTNLGKVYDLKKEFTPKTPKGAFLPISPPWVKVDFDKEILG